MYSNDFKKKVSLCGKGMLRKLSQEEKVKEKMVVEGQRWVESCKRERKGRLAYMGMGYRTKCNSVTIAFICRRVRAGQWSKRRKI